MLTEKNAIWRDIMEARYGNLKSKVLIVDISVLNKHDSIWWRDLILLDNYEHLLFDHFTGAVRCNLGNDSNIPMWYASWAGNKSLMELFPDLFAITDKFMETVNFVGDFVNGSWIWNIATLFASVPIIDTLATVFPSISHDTGMTVGTVTDHTSSAVGQHTSQTAASSSVAHAGPGTGANSSSVSHWQQVLVSKGLFAYLIQ